MNKERNLGIDILCCFGVMMLLGMQYIHLAGFSDVSAWADAVTIAVRCFCQSGAMVLCAGTGYVLSKKKYTPGYFKIFIRLIYIYLICSLAALLLRTNLLDEFLSPMQEIQAVIQFNAAETSRFAGMYFALLLASPFLNAAFQGLPDRKARLGFFVVTTAVSTLQPMLYFPNPDVYLIPEWCKGLFPAAAYLGGACIRRYSKKKHPAMLLLTLFSLTIAQALLVFSSSLKRGELYCPWLSSVAALPGLGTALCLLELLHSEKNGSGSIHRFFAGAAGGALSALLLGEPLLSLLMPRMSERVPDLQIRLLSGLVLVPLVFILCAAAGLLLQLPLLGVRASLHHEEDVEADADENKPELAPPVEPIPEKLPKKKTQPRKTSPSAKEKAPGSKKSASSAGTEKTPQNPPKKKKKKKSGSAQKSSRSSSNQKRSPYQPPEEKKSPDSGEFLVPRRMLTQPARPINDYKPQHTMEVPIARPPEPAEKPEAPTRILTAEEIIGSSDSIEDLLANLAKEREQQNDKKE